MPSEVTSTSTVTDGSWHLAAATFAGSLLEPVPRRDRPGQRADAQRAGRRERVVSGDRLGPRGRPDVVGRAAAAPSSSGSLAMVSLSPSAATGAQISALAGSASTAAYESALSSDVPPTENWEMADSGTQAYTGAVAVSGGGTTMPCQRVEATVEEVKAGTTSCVLPAGPGSCPAPSPTTLLSSLVDMAPLTAPTTATSAQLDRHARPHRGVPARRRRPRPSARARFRRVAHRVVGQPRSTPAPRWRL